MHNQKSPSSDSSKARLVASTNIGVGGTMVCRGFSASQKMIAYVKKKHIPSLQKLLQNA